jgi:signal peptidase II
MKSSWLVGGGACNLLDRIAYGRVVAFMKVGVGWLRTGIFNVADMALMMGAAIVAIASYRTQERRTRS